MNSIHWTLRWPRTSREVYGYDVQFEQPKSYTWLYVALAFVLGLIIGGV
jgi:hypothetical protein